MQNKRNSNFGPFSYNGVAAFLYGTQVLVVSFLTMLSFKTVINTFFIVDFERMSAVDERKVMIWMGVVTSVCTLTHMLEEAATRNAKGLDHFARWCFNIYHLHTTFFNNVFRETLMFH